MLDDDDDSDDDDDVKAKSIWFFFALISLSWRHLNNSTLQTSTYI